MSDTNLLVNRNKKPSVKLHFVDFWFPSTIDNIMGCRIYELLSKRFEIVLDPNPDFLIYSCFGKEHLKYNCARIFYTGENVRPNRIECDFSFSFDPESELNFRLPGFRLDFEIFRSLSNEDLIEFRPKIKFCNFLYSNEKASDRIHFLSLLMKYKRVDSGGRVLNNLGYLVDNKLEFLKDYKFTIAFENASYPGYTTEKLSDALAAGSLPIYWGNPSVARDFNTKRFINCHDYSSFEEVVNAVIEVDSNDELYQSYLAQPIFTGKETAPYRSLDNVLDKFEMIFFGEHFIPDRRRDLIKYGYLMLL